MLVEPNKENSIKLNSNADGTTIMSFLREHSDQNSFYYTRKFQRYKITENRLPLQNRWKFFFLHIFLCDNFCENRIVKFTYTKSLLLFQ